jgi:hypothetical protein
MARLSFPTKFTTYLVAGRPILLHSPEYASVPAFFSRFPVGAWCDSEDANVLGESMKTLLTDKELYSRAVAQVRPVIREEFTEDIFLERFAAFLGVNKDILRKNA